MAERTEESRPTFLGGRGSIVRDSVTYNAGCQSYGCLERDGGGLECGSSGQREAIWRVHDELLRDAPRAAAPTPVERGTRGIGYNW